MKDPEIAGSPEFNGVIEPLKLLPGKSDAEAADRVKVPVKPEDVEKSTPVKVTVGCAIVRKLPRFSVLIDAVRLSNENPSVRMARFVTDTDRSFSGMMLRLRLAIAATV